MATESEKQLAEELFIKIQSYWNQGEQWRRSNRDLIQTLIRDALQAYGITNAERKVELQRMLLELESYETPTDFAGIANKVQKKITKLIVKNRTLLFLAGIIYVIGLAAPIREPLVSMYERLVDFYVAHTRKNIIVLRVGSPFDEEKPSLDDINLSTLVRAGQSTFTISTHSTTAKDLLEIGKKLKDLGTAPEIVSFDNYGIYEPSSGVPNRGSTITELFGKENFVELVGPIAENIQSPGWVYINKKAKNAQAAIDLGLNQITCSNQASEHKDFVEKIHHLLLMEPGHVKHSICSLRDFGEIAFATAEIIIRTRERIGLARKYLILQQKNGVIQPISITEDVVSGCYLDRKTNDACENYLLNIRGSLSILDAAFIPSSENIALPKVDILSPTDMINYRGEGYEIEWSDFEWRTTHTESVAFEIIIFRISGKDRFIILSPAPSSKISSSYLYDGSKKSWRIITVTKAGQPIATEWKPFKRIDCRRKGRCNYVE